MRILKRKARNEEFFYLQHSFRKNKKIITKEKYLGKKLPSEKEIEKIKKELFSEELKTLDFKLEKIRNNFQREWHKIPDKMRKKELEEIAIVFTYNTNAIEGSVITLEETREILEEHIAPNKPLRDIEETENHAKIFFKMLGKKEKITRELILRWHKEIFLQSQEELAGKFRDYLVRVGDYLAPDWQDIEKLIKELVKFIEENKKMPPVELSARIHYKFEKIHPFGDGNGRIGRLLMNYILWWNKYPMLIISYKKRKSYYRAFKKDENHFIKYFTKYYISVHKNRYL